MDLRRTARLYAFGQNKETEARPEDPLSKNPFFFTFSIVCYEKHLPNPLFLAVFRSECPRPNVEGADLSGYGLAFDCRYVHRQRYRCVGECLESLRVLLHWATPATAILRFTKPSTQGLFGNASPVRVFPNPKRENMPSKTSMQRKA